MKSKELLITAILIVTISTAVLALTGEVKISVSITQGYHSYTMALNQRQDYYVQCNGTDLINVTPIGQPIILENVTGGFCS